MSNNRKFFYMATICAIASLVVGILIEIYIPFIALTVIFQLIALATGTDEEANDGWGN